MSSVSAVYQPVISTARISNLSQTSVAIKRAYRDYYIPVHDETRVIYPCLIARYCSRPFRA